MEGPVRTWVSTPEGDDRTSFADSRFWSGGRLSPDGTRIAFDSNGDIFLASVDGDGLVRLTGGNGYEGLAQWLPDGRTIAFVRGGTWWYMDTDGSNVRPVELPAGGDAFEWSPDGTRVAYNFYDQDPAKTGLYVYDLDGESPPRLVALGAADSPRWSPDGSELLFMRYADGRRDVWLADAEGGSQRMLLGEPDIAHYAAEWSPSGDRIAVTRKTWLDDGHGDLFTAAADGTDLRRITNTDTHEALLDWGTVPECDLVGTDADDVIEGTSASETICAGRGSDRIVASGGTDLIMGGAGFDRIDFRHRQHGVNVDLRRALAQSHTVLGIEGVLGTDADDVIFGGDDRNVFNAYGGNDTAFGRDGHDTINAGPGDDVLRPGLGGDDLHGGDGRDTVSFTDAPSRVRVNLGNSLAYGQSDVDILVHVEKVIGSRFDDTIIGGDGRDVLKGGDGEDTIEGQDGPDDLYGGDDRDLMYGNGGSDELFGEGGRDYADGGSGYDDCRTEQEIRC